MSGEQCRPDHTPRSTAPDLGLHCFLRPVCPNISGNYGRLKKKEKKNKCMCTFQGQLIHFQGDSSVKLILLPFEKGSALKGKNLLPLGANSFALE